MSHAADPDRTAPLDVAVGSAGGSAVPLDHHTRSRAIRPWLARPGAYLALDEPGGRLLIELNAGVTHLGRGLSADIRVEDQGVSRRHALIVIDPDGAFVLDDRSASGTFVNGCHVERAQLHDGDTLALGPVTLSYVAVQRAQQRAASADAERSLARRLQRALDGWLAGRMRARAHRRRGPGAPAAPAVAPARAA